MRDPGIEPGVPACHTGAFTKLARRAFWSAAWESNPATIAYQAPVSDQLAADWSVA